MMIASDLVWHRLYNQRLTQEKYILPDQAVSWFGAMQAQDYTGVKWAIGLRCYDATNTAIEQAIVNQTIVRTWLMRGTLQVVAATDVTWMLALLAPRIIANSTRRYKQLGLDDVTFDSSYKILIKILQGRKALMRSEIMLALEEEGISVSGQRGYHILRRAGLEGLICFGPIKGKQETFVLLNEWVAHNKSIQGDEALFELAVRYFSSHGPAALPDFVWWSGLKIPDARAGLEKAKSQLQQVTIEGQPYWMAQNKSISKSPSSNAYLLPAFDEYFLGYKMRNIILDSNYDKRVVSNNGVFRPMIVIDGQIIGIWKQMSKKGNIIIVPTPFRSLTEAENEALLTAVDHYGAFLGQPTLLLV